MLTELPLFSGATYRTKDAGALTRQLDAVRSILLRGGWHTLGELVAILARDHAITASEAAVSARLRDLRKLKYGAYKVPKRVREGHARLWEYHL